MQDTNSIPESQTDSNPTPTSQEILAAPEGEWKALCQLADANVEFYRAWRKRNAQPAKKSRKRSRPRSRPSTSTRGWSAASVLSQKVGDAMAEAVERINEEDPSETRSILITGGDETLVIEVAA
jgi:hypothetical protein